MSILVFNSVLAVSMLLVNSVLVVSILVSNSCISFKVAKITVGSTFKFTLEVLETTKIIFITKSFTLPESAVGLYVSGYLDTAISCSFESNIPTSLIINPPTLPGITVSITIQFGFSSSIFTLFTEPSQTTFFRDVCSSVGLYSVPAPSPSCNLTKSTLLPKAVAFAIDAFPIVVKSV
ncbi:Uncharacterised protein [Clostridioides difficile]|nr:Uncharacterised protein [Clostridioides difficile]VFF10921.1 Uncharacterised protein [Clostridioides difficile]VFF70161.1 Uncharacterised protein [Clostridioides difficile]VIC57876.1 Uncharacterised protein [Clostridioides difficile]VIC60520.1 Uncharacterised protein [Clostridioides difficile]